MRTLTQPGFGSWVLRTIDEGTGILRSRSVVQGVGGGELRSGLSITELEDRARRGDACSFGQLLRIHNDDLRGVVWSVLRDQHDVDDAMQAAYEKAFRAIGDFSGRSTLKTWLHSICYRTAVDIMRYESRRVHERVGDMAACGSVDVAETRIEAAAVLDSLIPEQRAVLYLTAALGYTFDEVSEITGINRGTVASRVSRAKQRLRKEVGS